MSLSVSGPNRGKHRRHLIAALVVLAGVLVAHDAVAASARKGRPRHRSAPLELIWQVESLDGRVLASHLPDEPMNPASVLKVGTSLWALERLGPDYRFETRFYARGTLDPQRGILKGDLVVHGGADPDFQVENGFLVAAALNQLGVRQVTGALVVDSRFWMGWENGSEGTDPDPTRRGVTMATRLRQSLDSRRWNGATRAAWREVAARRGLDVAHPPRVVVTGGVGVDGARTGELLVVHRSGPLVATLRRFNCFSNNDIERVGASLGPVDELAGLLTVRCDAPHDAIQLQTSSGLGENRLSPRLIVRLLREFRETCRRIHMPLEAVLPVAGCDPGTVSRFFPTLANNEASRSLVGKTGTLTSTDGGISVLAGFVNTAQGDLAFCVAVPRAQGRLRLARHAEEKWLLDVIAEHGGPEPRQCLPPVADPDTGASVIVVAGADSFAANQAVSVR